mgnify:CR=1 FL=1
MVKKIDLSSQNGGKRKFFELFNLMLEKSDFNLNQIVKSDSLVIPNQIDETFVDTLKEFLEIAPDVMKLEEDKENFWNVFTDLDDYEDNKKFINWLIRYVDAIIKPYEDAKFLQETNDDVFREMSNYCFQNFILQDIGKVKEEEIVWDPKQIDVLKRVMSTFIELVIVGNYSKENAIVTTQHRFGINEQQCEIWWPLIQENEEKLWRILLMKQYTRIEGKLNRLLSEIEE